MLWIVPLLPIVAGLLLWVAGKRLGRTGLAVSGAAVLGATIAIAAWAAVARAEASYRWGVGLDLMVSVDDPASVAMILVPSVGLVALVFASAHERARGLLRLVSLLLAFVGAMELVVLAADVLTLLIGWELVGVCSWALIGHEWWKADSARAAGHAFIATRAGDLGLFAAAGAALAGTGSLEYAALIDLEGGWHHLLVGGVVLAAAAKSAQVPFSPWLFSAMAGPTSVSALLHAATMVAAGAYLLVRLHAVLDRAAWFAPTVIAVGLVTAFGGGIVASMQQHAKKLLAASTSAQFGLMFVGVGAGAPAAALAHLVSHAAFKAPLFFSAGVAIEAAGSAQLDRMRLGRVMPWLAVATGLSVLALAAVPPLGGAWTKEAIVAGAGHHSKILAVAVAASGALTAWYAGRFQLLAYGPSRDAATSLRVRSGAVEVAAVVIGGLASVALGLLWLPGSEELVERLAGTSIPSGASWETTLSVGLVVAACLAVVGADRSRWLEGVHRTRAWTVAGDWLGLPVAVEACIVTPTLRLAHLAARADDRVLDALPRGAAGLGRRFAALVALGDERVVDAGVSAAAAFTRWMSRIGATVTERGIDGALHDVSRLVGMAGSGTRRAHPGLAHRYYALVVAVAAVLVVVLAGT